jgi:hypothetical protein
MFVSEINIWSPPQLPQVKVDAIYTELKKWVVRETEDTKAIISTSNSC